MELEHSHEAAPPDINDMFIAGLELRHAVALQKQIEAHPEIEPKFWWMFLRRAQS